jgi:simple sugar transport system permease protein
VSIVAGWQRSVRRLFAESPIAGPLATLIIVFILFSLFVPHFFALRTVSGIVNAATLVGMVTIGVTLLMISGEFDLSVGPLAAMGGYLYAFNTMDNGSPVVALLLAVLVPAALGCLNGLILVRTGIPSFIVTLGTSSIYRGAVWIISGGTMVQTLEKLTVYDVFNGRLDVVNDLFQGAKFRTSALWLLLVALICQYVLVRTRYGNHVFAAGGNPAAAQGQGVNVRRVKVINFMISGALSGFAGLLQFSQYKSVQVATGAGWELSAIAASVVGGALLSGGSGGIWGALIGVLLISALRTGVVLLDIPVIPADNFPAVVGATIVAAVILNNWLRSRA